MKRYEGKRSYGQVFVTVNGRALDPRFDLRFHSPDGFEWGYGGSGPAQLALALLADCLGDDSRALDLYQEFKFAVVAGLPREGSTLTSGVNHGWQGQQSEFPGRTFLLKWPTLMAAQKAKPAALKEFYYLS